MSDRTGPGIEASTVAGSSAGIEKQKQATALFDGNLADAVNG